MGNFIRILLILYLAILGLTFLILGVVDPSIAAPIPDPPFRRVLIGAIAVILAGILRLWIDKLTIENEFWTSDVVTELEGVRSVFGKFIGTFLFILCIPYWFTQMGEWIYYLNWWIFSGLQNWWEPLIFLLSLWYLIFYSLNKDFIYYEWLLGRVFFLGILLPNAPLFNYTVIPAIIGIWIRLFYQLLKQIIITRNE